ncbi:MAG: DNA repair protein RecN, partial [bacterium]
AARLKQEYEKEAEALSGMRQAVAKVLTEKIVEELHNLNMKNVVFVIDFQKSAPQKQGMDKIEFRFSSNLGEKVSSLSEIASGGELSRVMLALKVILAKIDQIPVLIFDEIDTGIGGQTAQIVGEKMALLAKERQVICVTHAPQIACQAHSHFVISKKIADGRTATQIVKLNKTGRIEELCRMLGEINELTRQYAKEMLKGKSIE